MEVSPFSISKCEEKALKGLLEAFGSLFSLEEIASAYCKAERNADLAGQILYETNGRTSACLKNVSNGDARDEPASESSYGYISNKSYRSNGKFRLSKQKWHSVSAGTVSSILGKDYIKPIQVANGPCETTKPVKLAAEELPMSEVWGEDAELNPSKNYYFHNDMEDFLFKMLGDGFHLGRDVIRQVLDKCGYDMYKSMEKLLDISAVTLDKRNTYLSKSTEKFTEGCPKFVGSSSQNQLQPMYSPGGDSSIKNGKEFPGQEKARNDLQKEVLVALFNAAERSEELSTTTEKASMRCRARRCMAKRSIALGELVVEPPRELNLEEKADSVDPQQDNDNNEDGEDNYQFLRRAVKEYRGTMKEYYKAAVDAFAKGDHDKANKLMAQGQFFHEKACEADEESSRRIFETKNAESEDEMLLDLHKHDAKEARSLLKCHLSSLCGIPSIKYLKVTIETNEEDTSKGARRKWVTKLLEKESIEWTEGGDAGTIQIRLDNINRKRLSFA